MALIRFYFKKDIEAFDEKGEYTEEYWKLKHQLGYALTFDFERQVNIIRVAHNGSK